LAQNPLASGGNCDGFAAPGSGQIRINGFDQGAVDISNISVVGNNEIRLVASISDLFGSLTLAARAPILFGCLPEVTATGNITADRVTVDARIRATTNSEGEINAEVTGLNTDLQGVNIDVNFIPGLDLLIEGLLNVVVNVFGDIIINALEGTITGAITGAIQNEALPQIPEGVLLSVNQDTNISLGFLLNNLATQNGGLNIGVGATVDSLDDGNVPSGFIEVDLDLPLFETDNVPPALGSEYSGGPLPNLTNSTPLTFQNFDAAVIVSSDILNQALASAYNAGLLNIMFDSSRGLSVGALQVLETDTSFLGENSELRVRVSASSPPVVDFTDLVTSFEANSRAGLAALDLNDLIFDFEFRTESGVNFEAVFSAVVDIDLAFNIGINNNFIDFDIEDQPVIRVTSVGGEGLRPSNDFINGTLDLLLPQILPDLLEVVSTIPIPSFQGYGFNVTQAFSPNFNPDYAALAAMLVRVEDTQSAAAPSTFVAQASTANSAGAFVSRSVAALVSDAPVVNANEVTLELSGDNPTDQPLQYRYRIDGGKWSLWKERDSIVIRNMMAGDHDVEVCSRTHMLKEDPDCAFTTVSFGPQ